MTLIKKYGEQICQLELNRPDKRNALNKTMIKELISFLEDTAESDKFRVLILSGVEGFFSAGADLQWMQEGVAQSYQENIDDANLFNQLYHTLNNFPKPVIAKVDKGAFGGAIGLVACADIAITSPDATFAFSEVTLGLVPATIAPYIVKKTGAAVARDLLLTARAFTGEEALAYNLVQFLFPSSQLSVKTRELASKLAKNSPSAMSETKILLNRLGDSIVSVNDEMKEHCAGIIAKARSSHNGQEGVKAFFEKRKPNWND